ncbi:nitrate reductase molybdenum cofactor assembly chaperone [Spirillospora albida]|uniref:nitrate reductase molybdenum cofactor assembly chaperone n=1 Tax=Spirillospora albida TaxID=58123 RepID=UPI000A07177A|nr:nitrate reductase molybdenum cofactor assembly chaperone [Spirillospora albida]
MKLRERRALAAAPASALADADRAALLRLVSLLLQYPDEELLAARVDLAAAAADLPEGPWRRSLVEFTAWFAAARPMECARHYVTTFDLRRRSSLYLTYYLHGDTRRRGMAMLTLKQRFRAAGLTPPADELPDHLPVVCEFAALAGPGTGEAPLRQHRRGLELIRAALRDSGSPYVHVLDALCAALPPLTDGDRDAVADLVAAGPPAEDVGLAPFGPPDHMTGTPFMSSREACR